MKLILIFLIFLLNTSFAGISLLPTVEVQKYQESSSEKKMLELLKKIEALESSKLYQLKKVTKKRKIKRIRVPALSIFKGSLYTALVSTNRRPETFIIKLTERNKYFPNAKLACIGGAELKRVVANCNLLVSREGLEYKVSAKLTDLDGTKGIIPTRYYSSESRDFMTKNFSVFMATILEASKTKTNSIFGQSEETTSKNAMKSGLSKVFQNGANSFSSERPLVIAIIKPPKKILIHFLKGINL